ncbi:MAG: tape measure protein [Rhizobiaceae bacterium]
MSDSAKQTSAQLLLVAGSAQKAAEASAPFVTSLQEHGVHFAPTVELYAKLARSTEGLGISSERLLNVTRTIGMAYKVSGASAEETANSMRQLAQGLQAGRCQAMNSSASWVRRACQGHRRRHGGQRRTSYATLPRRAS